MESFDSRVVVNEYGTRVWEGLFYSEMLFGMHEALYSTLSHIYLYPTGAAVNNYESVGGDYTAQSGFIRREDILEAYGRWHDPKGASPKALALQAVQLLRSGSNPSRHVSRSMVDQLRHKWR